MSYGYRNLTSLLTTKPGPMNIAITAAAGTDNSEVTSATIDRYSFTQGRGQSAVFVMQVTATMASGETAAVSCKFEDSADSSSWAAFGAAMSTTTIVSSAGGAVTAKSGTVQYGINLSSARRYIRVKLTTNLSASGTDTALSCGVVVVGGQSQLPAA